MSGLRLAPAGASDAECAVCLHVTFNRIVEGDGHVPVCSDFCLQAWPRVRALIDERDHWKANCESWRMAYNAWQDWAGELLDDLGRQPTHGSHGDEPAREIIAQLVGMAPGVPRCQECGCFSTRHEADDEELRGCVDCECHQFVADK